MAVSVFIPPCIPTAFDPLELDGEYLRSLPLGARNGRLAKPIGRRRLGIKHTDQDSAAVFRQACKMGGWDRVETTGHALRVGPVAGPDQGDELERPAAIRARE
jgi:hypothetical protein